ncbi:hypothetical protein [Mycobacterium sp.]
MADSALRQQVDEVRLLLVRARELFGDNPIEPPRGVVPRTGAATASLH